MNPDQIVGLGTALVGLLAAITAYVSRFSGVGRLKKLIALHDSSSQIPTVQTELRHSAIRMSREIRANHEYGTFWAPIVMAIITGAMAFALYFNLEVLSSESSDLSMFAPFIVLVLLLTALAYCVLGLVTIKIRRRRIEGYYRGAECDNCKAERLRTNRVTVYPVPCFAKVLTTVSLVLFVAATVWALTLWISSGNLLASVFAIICALVALTMSVFMILGIKDHRKSDVDSADENRCLISCPAAYAR